MRPFEINDKAVCVDGKFDPRVAKLYCMLPKEGNVYVVRAVRLGIRPDCRSGDLSLLLVGLMNPNAESRSALERGFSQDRFRHPGELDSREQEAAAETVDAVSREEVTA